MKRSVLVAMSGGVDSSAAALILKREGYDVAGVTMCLGIGKEGLPGRQCCSPQDVDDARRVCRQLDIPHYVMDFSDDMENLVIRNFVDEYLAGRTPNLCVRCNRHLKFGILLNKAKALGFDALATGHYARTGCAQDGRTLLRGLDATKDQSYFLYSIPRETLDRILFPLGDLRKKEVRDIARREGLAVSEKRESQDICFIPGRDVGLFFESRGVPSLEGDIIDVRGSVAGRHRGIARYTIGQRRGIGGGSPVPLYVIRIDPESNTVTVGERENLLSSGLMADELNLLMSPVPGRGSVKIRYGKDEIRCTIAQAHDTMALRFDEPVMAVTPGQSAVLYDGDAVIGGGVIRESFPGNSVDISADRNNNKRPV